MVIAQLAEDASHGWWHSRWFSSQSDSFLSPVFGNHTNIARYHGATEAGRLVHDERIGVGQVFHLFRLPTRLELRLFDKARHNSSFLLIKPQGSIGDAIKALEQLSRVSISPNSGPIRIGDTKQFNNKKWIGDLASHYLAGFEAGHQTFPYFSEHQ